MYQSRPILDNWNHDNIVVRSINPSKLRTAINIQGKNITWRYKGSENRKRNAITEVSKQTIYGLLFLPWLGKVLVMIGEISAGNILRRDRTLAWSSSPSPLLKDRRGMKKKNDPELAELPLLSIEYPCKLCIYTSFPLFWS